MRARENSFNGNTILTLLFFNLVTFERERLRYKFFTDLPLTLIVYSVSVLRFPCVASAHDFGGDVIVY